MTPTVDVQTLLVEEQCYHEDIIQTTLQDGAGRLGYKILTGYVWSWLHCPDAKYIAKSDDNAVLDLTRLVNVLDTRQYTETDIICSTPIRNCPVSGSSEKGHMTGNWTVSKYNLQGESDFIPDFCVGYLYLTSPKVGAALTQVALTLYNNMDVSLVEDYLVTGYLRHRLNWVALKLLEPDLIWETVVSHCPWCTFFNNFFFNRIVISKVSSRSGTVY